MTQAVSPTYHISQTASILKTALKKRLQASGCDITPEQLGVLRLLYAQSETVSMNIRSYFPGSFKCNQDHQYSREK